MKNLIVSRRRIRGQGMTEYIIIVALIAIASIGAYTYFGKTVRNQTAAITAGLAGQQTEATSAAKQAADAEKAGAGDAAKNRGLSQFADNVGNH